MSYYRPPRGPFVRSSERMHTMIGNASRAADTTSAGRVSPVVAHLVEQLLLLARLDEESGLKLSTFALREVIAESIAFRRHVANGKLMTLQISGDGRAEVWADRVVMRVLVDNLLDNAIKYGRNEGTVDFNLRMAPTVVELTVRDDGPGVSAEEMGRLADRFYRASSATTGGSGLGLSIVSRIAARCGSEMRIQKGLNGQGLGICITLPTLSDEAGRPNLSASAVSQSARVVAARSLSA